MATDKSKNDHADLIFNQPGLAPWDLLHRALGGEAHGANPGEGSPVLEEIKRGGLNAPLQSGALPLSAYAPLYRQCLEKLAGDKYSPATIENRQHGLEAVRRYWPDFDTAPASALQTVHTKNLRGTIEQNMSLAHGQPPSKNTLNGYVRHFNRLVRSCENLHAQAAKRIAGRSPKGIPTCLETNRAL